MEAHGPHFPRQFQSQICASMSPSMHFTWAKDPLFVQKARNLCLQPCIALGWTLDPMGVQRRPEDIGLGLRSREIPHQSWEGRGLERWSGGRWGKDHSRRSGQGGQRHEARLRSTCRRAQRASRTGSWDGRRRQKGSLGIPSTGLESDRPRFKSWLCSF